ncbi:major facilitator superfamily domain-containing protein [Xylariaceae sp. FL0016]|nr:major facilitator superfamily domain-containing protein [Xylariaceae sp. FL0016]
MEGHNDLESQTPTLRHAARGHQQDEPSQSNIPGPVAEYDSSPPSGNKEAPGLVAPDVDTCPDGGFQAWLCIAGGFCATFASFGWINCIGVFQDYYQAHQLSEYSSSDVAWISGTESFMLFFCGLISGKLADSYGPRYPLLLGSFLHVFGLMMVSLSTKYYQFFLAQCIVSGIGTSFLFYPTITAAGSWFKRHRALAFGIMVSGSSVGGVVLPIMVEHLVDDVGFGWAIRITAFLLLGLLIFANIAIKSRLPPVKKPFSLKEYVAPYAEIPFLLLAIGSFFLYLGAFLPFNFIIVQAHEAGLPSSLTDYLVPIINATSIFGRIVPAYLGDKYGVFNVCIVFTLFSGIISIALWLPALSPGPIVAYAVLYGFASGLTLSIIPALVASISDVAKLGFRTGTLYSLSAVGVLVGSPIAGAIVTSQNGEYTGLKIFCGVMLLTAGVFMTFSRIKLTGPRLLVKQ